MIKLSTYLGHREPEHTYWYIEAVPELLELASERAARALAQEWRPMNTSTLPALLQRFFTDRLTAQLAGQPEYDCGLSRHLPIVAPLCEPAA